MSTKEWVYQGSEQVGVYQDTTADNENNNPAVVEITNPVDFNINYASQDSEQSFSKLIAEIPANVFDEIAIAWCKKRKLQGALGGPVGKEWGSPDCDWE
jgi:hypothetical protein